MRPLEEERCGGLVAHLVRKLHELVRLDIPTVGVSPEAGVHVGCQVSRHDRLGAGPVASTTPDASNPSPVGSGLTPLRWWMSSRLSRLRWRNLSLALSTASWLREPFVFDDRWDLHGLRRRSSLLRRQSVPAGRSSSGRRCWATITNARIGRFSGGVKSEHMTDIVWRPLPPLSPALRFRPILEAPALSLQEVTGATWEVDASQKGRWLRPRSGRSAPLEHVEAAKAAARFEATSTSPRVTEAVNSDDAKNAVMRSGSLNSSPTRDHPADD